MLMGRAAVVRAFLIPFTLLALVLCSGCEQEEVPVSTPLATDSLLYPPAQVVLTPGNDLIALVAEGEERGLALYRSELPGKRWQRWAALPAPAVCTDADVAAGEEAVAVAACFEKRLWFASVAYAAGVATGAPPRVEEIEVDSTVLSLSLDAAWSHDAARTVFHLVYLMQAAPDTGRVIAYRRSLDGGLSWSKPQLLAQGNLGQPSIFARSDQPGTVDVVYSRDGFLRWRGSQRDGKHWIAEKEIRVRVADDSRNALARIGHLVLSQGESTRNQVVCSTSRNGGHNWERATAIAKSCDHRPRPSLDSGYGRFWVAFCQGDSLIVLRSTDSPWNPKHWSETIAVAGTACSGGPSVVALPDSTAGVLYATPAGEVFFASGMLSERE
jgi:hypothetical protein